MIAWDLTLCFYFTFLHAARCLALVRHSNQSYRMNFPSDTLVFCKLWLHLKKWVLHVKHICWICHSWTSPFALFCLKSGDNGKIWTPVVRGWRQREPELLHCTACRWRRITEADQKYTLITPGRLASSYRKYLRDLHKKADFSIMQTCFEESATNSDVNNCTTLGRITILLLLLSHSVMSNSLRPHGL